MLVLGSGTTVQASLMLVLGSGTTVQASLMLEC